MFSSQKKSHRVLASKSLAGKFSPTTQRKHHCLESAANPCIESLESRVLNSVTSFINEGALVIRGDAANDTITLQNAGNFTFVNGKAFANSSITQFIDIESGDGNDTINILSTRKLTFIDGQAGNDSVKLGTNGLISGITGNVDIGDSSGSVAVTLDDSADILFRSIKLDAGNVSETIDGFSLGSVSVTTINPSTLTLNGGVAGNVFTIKNTLATATTTLNTGIGSDTVAVEATSSALTINGVNGPDIVTIGSKKDTTKIAGPVTIGSTSGSINLTVDDSADTQAREITMGFAAIPGSTLRTGTITGLSPATIQFNENQVRFVTVNAGTGGNHFIIQDTARNNFNVLTSIKTGKGQDFTELLRARGAINIEGQGGADEVDLGRAGNSRGIIGAVTIGNNNANFDTTTVQVNDAADTAKGIFKLTRSGADGLLTGFTTGGIFFKNNQVGSLFMNGGRAGNTFDIADVTDLLSINLFAGAGDDKINIQKTTFFTNIEGVGGHDIVTLGQNGNMQPLLREVTLSNTRGSFDLILNDQADAQARNVTLDFPQAEIPDQGIISGINDSGVLFQNVAALTINAGSGGNTFNINGTTGISSTNLNTGAGLDKVFVHKTDSPLFINGNNGRDVVTISGADHTLANIHSDISIKNTNAFTNIVIDDSADTTSRNINFDAQPNAAGILNSSITGLGQANFNYVSNDLASLTVLAGTGGNNITVTNLAAGGALPTTTIKTGQGDDQVNILRTNSALNIDGQAGIDNVHIGLNNNAQAINGQVFINNAQGTTNLTINDQADLQSRNVNMKVTFAGPNSPSNTTLGTITGLTPGAIRYSPTAVSFVVVNAGDGNGITGNTFTVDGTAIGRTEAPSVTFLRTGNGSDKVNVLGTNNQLSLLLGGGNDIVNVGSLANTLDPIQGGIAIDGGAGIDSLTLNDQGSKTAHDYFENPGSLGRVGTSGTSFQDVESARLNKSLVTGNPGGANQPPQIADLKFTPSIKVGHNATLSGRLVDANKKDKLYLTINWGDGSKPQKLAPGRTPFNLTHHYSKKGTYKIHLIWSDNHGATNSQDLQLSVRPHKTLTAFSTTQIQ